MRVALAFKDQRSSIEQISALRESHPDSFEVAKYFVKVHINVPKDGFIIDAKQTFNYFLAAEKVAEEISAKCPRLVRKIQLMKIKTFEMFFTEQRFQQLTAGILSTVGTKGLHAPNVMSVLAEQNSKKGDHDKAQTYIQRAMALATEVLDGIKVHKKYIGILATKSQILLRRKKHAEALQAVDEMQALVNEIYGKDNALMQAQLHLKRVLIYTEMKGEEYKAEDNLKLYAKVSEKIYAELEGCKEDSCLNFTYQVELMTGYLKIMRPDKVTKIHKDLVKALEDKGQARSLAFLTVEFLSLQAEQDQSAVEGKIGQLLALGDDELGRRSREERFLLRPCPTRLRPMPPHVLTPRSSSASMAMLISTATSSVPPSRCSHLSCRRQRPTPTDSTLMSPLARD